MCPTISPKISLWEGSLGTKPKMGDAPHQQTSRRYYLKANKGFTNWQFHQTFSVRNIRQTRPELCGTWEISWGGYFNFIFSRCENHEKCCFCYRRADTNKCKSALREMVIRMARLCVVTSSKRKEVSTASDTRRTLMWAELDATIQTLWIAQFRRHSWCRRSLLTINGQGLYNIRLHT